MKSKSKRIALSVSFTVPDEDYDMERFSVEIQSGCRLQLVRYVATRFSVESAKFEIGKPEDESKFDDALVVEL